MKYVLLGELDLDKTDDVASPVTFGVSQQIKRPNYSDSQFYNDIALIKLNQTVKFNRFIDSVCLHQSHKIKAKEFLATGQYWQDLIWKKKLEWNKKYFFSEIPRLERRRKGSSIFLSTGIWCRCHSIWELQPNILKPDWWPSERNQWWCTILRRIIYECSGVCCE